ncbi:hypothetical protein NE237_002739 [Protea cynaroides]|uniref:Purple acid phosphatase n=1 Tax=Protea cynaroides TaxID=273540 RepID=A0A9Q0QRT0_9MAGN|nr:hypothetical protein NE237_002739 [Protea cynaroides]
MYLLQSFNFSSFFFLCVLLFGSSSTALSPTVFSPSISSSQSLVNSSIEEFKGYTAISEFRLLNRRSLLECSARDQNPYLEIHINEGVEAGIKDSQNVTITVSGVLDPSDSDWVAMISPSSSSVEACPLSKAYYVETGDLSKLPFLCHYPVKAQFLSNDPDYLGCKKQECKSYKNGICSLKICSASLTFHVINIRTDIEFVLFTGGFNTPCLLRRTGNAVFSNSKSPLYGHLSSIDSTGDSMRLTWVSGDDRPQQVQYGDGKSQTSQVTTFKQEDMCKGYLLKKSPAEDFGWHDPGFIHSAVMTGLKPLTSYSYRYGSDSVGWSDQIQFQTPPEGGSPELKFLAYGDMGKAPYDASVEHYIQPGSISVADAIAQEVALKNVDSIFHIRDISYATGFLVEWDYFLHQIAPVASHVSYMTAIGNHERHRPMYSSKGGLISDVDSKLVKEVEPLLMDNKVDLVLWGHVHNYERTCAVYQNDCKAMPRKDPNGVDIYDSSTYNAYNAPVHLVIGMAGFQLDKFPFIDVAKWSLVRIAEYGYARFHVTKDKMMVEHQFGSPQQFLPRLRHYFRFFSATFSIVVAPSEVDDQLQPEKVNSCRFYGKKPCNESIAQVSNHTGQPE